MGSSQSQLIPPPAPPPAASSILQETPSSPPRPSPTRRQSTLSRFSSLRRLSTLGRRDSDNTNTSSSKRLRQGSSTSDSPLNGISQDVKKKKHRKSNSIFKSTTPSFGLDDQSRAIESPVQMSRESTPIIESPDERMDEIIEATSTLNPSSTISPPPAVSILPPSPHHGSTSFSSSSPSPISIPLPTTPLSETSDPLAEERRQSISTIRDTLGPDWPVNTSSSPAVERLLHRLTRSTSSPEPNTPSSTSNPRLRPQRTMSDRLTALLGFSTPGDSPSTSTSPTDAPASSLRESNSVEETTIDDLSTRLAEAREELAETERQLNETRQRMDNIRNRRPPSGAVLIIQGLAQTHSESSPSSDDGSSGDDLSTMSDGPIERSRRPFMRNRRSSEGSHTGSRRGNGGDNQNEGSSLETQARMIGGLLTVAAAATATTLLAPSSPPPTTTARSPGASALESIVNRLRPRPNRTQSVEAALSGYLRTALQSSREGASPPSTATPTEGAEGSTVDTAEIISTDFQRFLEGVQGDLVGAVREFAGPLPIQPLDSIQSASPTTQPTPAAETTDVEMREVGEEESFVIAPSTAPTPILSTPTVEMEDVEAQPQAGPSTLPASPPGNPAIPTFHRQLGQNLPRLPNSSTSQVTGGADGQPRRLDFFRAHMFPPFPTNTSNTTSGTESTSETEGEETAMVPCIFIGVRSIRHDPNMTTDELVQHPNFPFMDGNVPPTQTSEDGTPITTTGTSQVESGESTAAGIPDLTPSPLTQTTSLPLTSSSTSPTTSSSALPSTTSTAVERRSLRERFLDRLNPSRNTPSTRERRNLPLNTYLVYVIGGNYPQNHPILSIPNLITGGPLTNEEMNLIGELMGQVKPPTVNQNEIEKSGLKIVKGSEISELNKKEEVLDICVDRCLICLSDYEPEDECRILNCRHGYHKECVDQWLSKGRNSCPACRSEAVDTSKKTSSKTSTSPQTSESPVSIPVSGQTSTTTETPSSAMEVDNEDARSID